MSTQVNVTTAKRVAKRVAKIQTFEQYLRTKGLNNNSGSLRIKELLEGKQIKITSNRSGHGLEIGETFTIDESILVYGGYISGLISNSNGYGSGAVYFYDFSLVQNTKEAIELELDSLESSKQRLEIEIELVKEKLKFLEETKSTELKEDDYKNHLVLKILTSDLTSDKKAEKIMSFLK